jgi:hypothetical protein
MIILETLAIEQQPDLFDSLSQPLGLTLVNDQDFSVYRLEINPDIVILIYKLSAEEGVRTELLDNISMHLKTVLVVADPVDLGESKFPLVLTDWLLQLEKRVPITVAAPFLEYDRYQRPKYLADDGLYLGEKSRLIFWRQDDRESILDVWKRVWGETLLAQGEQGDLA